MNTYEFGPFRVEAANHQLLRDGVVVPLKPKAFDTLLVLIENRGRVIPKEELIRLLWPDSVVEEASLTQNIYEVRKALRGSDRSYVENVPRRGYRFAGELTTMPQPSGRRLGGSAGNEYELAERDQRLLTRRTTESTEAYQLYLKGRYNWNKATPEGLWRAIDFFRAAIAIDPRYALAYVGIADAYTSLDWYGVLSTRESNPHALAAASKALEIDDGLAEAHASMAMARQYGWDWTAAENEYRKAITLNPDYAQAWQWYGVFLSFVGRFSEAVQHVRRAQELDPVSLSIGSQVGLVLLFARRYAEAEVQLQQVLEVDSGSIEARFMLAITLELQGRSAEAITIYRALPAGNPDFRAMLAHACSAAGDVEQARAILAGLRPAEGDRHLALFWLAVAYLGLGDEDQALLCLERACDDPDDSLLALNVFAMLDPLRGHPRFRRILRRMHLEP